MGTVDLGLIDMLSAALRENQGAQTITIKVHVFLVLLGHS